MTTIIEARGLTRSYGTTKALQGVSFKVDAGRIVGLIGPNGAGKTTALKDGDPLPSVRSVAAEFRLNPLTVLKGYQQLVDEQLVEKKRGRGMFVNEGARQALMKDERNHFLETEWPKIYAIITRLGFTIPELMKTGAKSAPATQPFPTQAKTGQEDDSNN